MNLLLLDTETTGIDKKTNVAVEAAASVYHVPTRRVLWSMGALVPPPKGQAWEEGARRANGLKDESLEEARLYYRKHDVTDPWSLILAAARVYRVTAVVAHNAEFDKGHSEGPCPELVAEFPWVCSMADFSYPREGSGRRLDYLCVDHGIASLGPFRHQASWDTSLIAALFDLIPDLEQQVLDALQPKVELQSHQAFEQNDLAKKEGFRWISDGGKKGWFRKLPLEKARAFPLGASPERPFRVSRVGAWE